MTKEEKRNLRVEKKRKVSTGRSKTKSKRKLFGVICN